MVSDPYVYGHTQNDTVQMLFCNVLKTLNAKGYMFELRHWDEVQTVLVGCVMGGKGLINNLTFVQCQVVYSLSLSRRF